MPSGNRQALPLTLLGGCIFVLVAALLLRTMPSPHRDTDYLVAGSIATLGALLVVFLVLITTTFRGSEVFFKKRKE